MKKTLCVAGLALCVTTVSSMAQVAAPPAPAAPAAPEAPAAPVAPVAPAAPAAAAPPQSDVFLADLNIGARTVTKVRNISNHAGYNNQPAFTKDAVLFVSDRTGSTDVYHHDIASGKTTQVTVTTAAEFSPTPSSDGKSFTVTRVADPDAKDTYTDSQQLWRYGMDGKPQAQVLVAGRVGYHTWIDATHVAMFLVGDDGKKVPHTLVLADLKTGASTLLNSAPGRSLGRTPDGKRVSFVDKTDAANWVVSAMKAGDTKPTVLVATPPKLPDEKESARSEDYCWLPDGSMMMAKGSTLLRWDGKIGTGLKVFAELGDLGGNIKRLAASKDGKRIAFVVQR
jgi:Tol biopolymer transport system component